MTNWPTAASLPSSPHNDGAPFPADPSETSTSNVTMETYFQQVDTCMDCHQLSNKRGFDFVWFMPLRAFPQAGTANFLELRGPNLVAKGGSILQPNDALGQEAAINRNGALSDLRHVIEGR
jgi:hypothetical protein